METDWDSGIKMRWAVWNEFRRLLCWPYIRAYFLIHGISWGLDWRIIGAPIIQRYPGSRIRLGDRLIMRSWRTSNPVAPYHPVFLSTRSAGAEIIIGDNFGITGGSVVAQEKVIIGNRVLIGGNCLITDTDFHPLDSKARVEQPKDAPSLPVEIGDDVFIGTQTIILKGTRIGNGSIIGAGSVVAGDIPPGAVAAGNPAQIIRQLER
jgi:acetyltransferase-like isoleucine patch superfamily enzyme